MNFKKHMIPISLSSLTFEENPNSDNSVIQISWKNNQSHQAIITAKICRRRNFQYKSKLLAGCKIDDLKISPAFRSFDLYSEVLKFCRSKYHANLFQTNDNDPSELHTALKSDGWDICFKGKELHVFHKSIGVYGWVHA